MQEYLDKDLSELYGYEVKRLNEQVKRNISRFPEDFMFQLNKEEIPEKFSKSQIETLNEKSNRQGFNIKKMPFAFTEQGIYMLATVLRGELAEQQSIFIMRTFREMRHYIKQNQQFVTRSEMELLSSKVTEISVQTVGLIDKQKQTDQDVKNFVIYKGQKLEADIAYIEIYQQANKSIYVVDDYMNAKSLQHLSQKADGVEVVLFTENGKGGRGFLTNSLVTDFQNEYPTIRIKPNPDCHDRLIILDYGEKTELVYHCGASSKDAGKKLCAINQITETAIIHPVIDRLLSLPDKKI
ncbi:MAG: ORF6N domain-containing protein [Lachnospiraceae bacterium]|nr:ORF6N domain-containing protein [Lachnospiraceae bacterium]